SHGGEVAERRSASISRRRQELKRWEQEHGREQLDPEMFAREILPRIQQLPLSDLMAATGLSLRYVSEIRGGERVPHPRHWPAFRAVVEPGRYVEGESRAE